jgi:hypothetical protein
MNKILDFTKPPKVKSTEDHNNTYMSDSGIAGTYVPNMSAVDMNKWKAKHITGGMERIEIRKTFTGVQLLVIVYKNPYQPPPLKAHTTEEYQMIRQLGLKRHNDVVISMNGKLDLTWENWWDLNEAVKEALEILI